MNHEVNPGPVPNQVRVIGRAHFQEWKSRVREILQQRRDAQLGAYNYDLMLAYEFRRLHAWIATLPNQSGGYGVSYREAR